MSLARIHFHLRKGQKLSGIGTYNDPEAVIFAPDWMQEALAALSASLFKEHTQIEVVLHDSYKSEPQTVVLNKKDGVSLKQLFLIARNEAANVTGIINEKNYEGSIFNLPLLMAMKDLAKHCVIIAKCHAIAYGGYPQSQPVNHFPVPKPTYLCDLAALQFQQKYNSGRLVLVMEQDDDKHGLLDNLIFQQVVGEEKMNYQQCLADNSGRFKPAKYLGKKVLFDTKAFSEFVALDVTLTGMGLEHCASESVNYKFLRYGTGFFAEGLDERGKLELQKALNQGIAQGLTLLFSKGCKAIKQIELPFTPSDAAINDVCKKNNIPCVFSNDDALKVMDSSKLVTAVTNCGDPHASPGNEMGYHSVDAAIATNMLNEANSLSPVLNQHMQERFLNVKAVLQNTNKVLPSVGAMIFTPQQKNQVITLYQARNGELALVFTTLSERDSFLTNVLELKTGDSVPNYLILDSRKEKQTTVYIIASNSDDNKTMEVLFPTLAIRDRCFTALRLKDQSSLNASAPAGSTSVLLNHRSALAPGKQFLLSVVPNTSAANPRMKK